MQKVRIKMAEKTLNVYQRLAEVRKVAPYIQKGNKGQQYDYVGSSDVLGALNDKINEVGLILVPEITGHQVTTYERTNAKGNASNEYFTELDMIYTWINIDDPSDRVAVKFYGQGIDLAGEKGLGKALTYAEKNFMLKFFNIATDKSDPDAHQQKTERVKGAARISANQLATIRNMATEYAEMRGQAEDDGIQRVMDFVCEQLVIRNLDNADRDQGSACIDALKAMISKHRREMAAARRNTRATQEKPAQAKNGADNSKQPGPDFDAFGNPM
jgi:hypothetical protein